MENTNGVCKEPADFYLMAVALRSFFLVLATHLLAGEVDTTLGAAGVSLWRRMWWWCRYYNPLNLSWRYYSMFAFRFTAHSWGNTQLALINHEQHPLMPPLPYIVGEMVHPLRVRRLEMAGLLSSQGILSFSAAYQGALGIQYAISTEGIPYLPNTTVPLAMVGLFRVMASKWVASKIHLDAFPYPCIPNPTSSSHAGAKPNLCADASHSLQMCKSSIGTSWASSPAVTKNASTAAPICKESPLSTSATVPTLSTIDTSSVLSPVSKAQKCKSSASAPAMKLHIDRSSRSGAAFDIHSMPSPAVTNQNCSRASIHLPYSQLPSLVLLSSFDTAHPPPSPPLYSPSVLRSPNSPLLPTISRPFSLRTSSVQAMDSMLSTSVSACETGPLSSKSSWNYTPSASQRPLLSSCSPPEVSHANSLSPSSGAILSLSSNSKFKPLTCPHAPNSSPSEVCQLHTSPLSSEEPLPYKSNRIVVGAWIGVLIGLVTMSFLPYKVAAAYKIPHTLLQFSMQIFYQYIAVSEIFFHGYLLYQGPRALANRVLFFDHWAFKAQTTGFYLLLMFMLVIALMDFVKHDFYRTCV